MSASATSSGFDSLRINNNIKRKSENPKVKNHRWKAYYPSVETSKRLNFMWKFMNSNDAKIFAIFTPSSPCSKKPPKRKRKIGGWIFRVLIISNSYRVAHFQDVVCVYVRVFSFNWGEWDNNFPSAEQQQSGKLSFLLSILYVSLFSQALSYCIESAKDISHPTFTIPHAHHCGTYNDGSWCVSAVISRWCLEFTIFSPPVNSRFLLWVTQKFHWYRGVDSRQLQNVSRKSLWSQIR